MEFNFLETQGEMLSAECLDSLENEYDFVFPDVLKKLYSNHNKAVIKEKDIKLAENELTVVDFIFPGDDENVSLDILLQEKKDYPWIGPNHIPFASDWGDDIFCWDKTDNSVWLYFPDSDEPVFIVSNIDVFFEELNK